MKKIFKSKLLIQVVVASMVATLATAGMVGAATTIGSNINTAGTLTATGAATIYGATSIGGALTATSTLAVSGVTTLAGNTILSTASSTGLVKVDSLQLGTVAITPTGTELNYVDGVTSAIQTQIDLKSPLASPTFTGTVILAAASSTGLVKVDSLQLGTVAITPTGTELNYVDGVTSAIQTQLDAKSPLASPTFTGTVILPTTTLGGVASSTQAGVGMKLNGLTVYGDATVTGTLIANNLNFAGGAITGVTDLTASGALAFATASSTGLVKVDSLQLGTVAITPTGTELNYVDGVTSALQTQLDAKSPLASPTFTGTVILAAASSTGLVKVDSLQLGTVAITPTGTELNYVDGVTSALQTQLDAKSPLASPTFTGTVILPTVTLGGVASSTAAGGVLSTKLNGLTVYGDLTVTGTFTPAQTSAATFAVGGGYGAAGLSIDADGNLQTNGNVTIDGTSILGGVASSTQAGVGMKLNGLTVYGTGTATTFTATTLTDGTASLSGGALTGLTTALTVAQGGTSSTTLSGILKGNGTGIMATAVADTDYLLPATAAATYAPLASPTLTGTVVLPTTTLGGVASSTQAGVGMKLNGLAVYGDLTVSAANTLGWTFNAGVNTACNTTCTNACVFGIDSEAVATSTIIVACDSALADNCLCAGAN